MSTIEMTDRSGTADDTGPRRDPIPAPRRRNTGWKVAVAAATAVAATIVAALVVIPHDPGATRPAAAEVLHRAADAQRRQPATGSTGATIRRTVDRYLYDGEPDETVELFVAADGMPYDPGPDGPVRNPYPSLRRLTSAALAAVPHDPAGARRWLEDHLGVGYGGSYEHRLYQFATYDVLPDPAVTPRSRAAILEVLAGFATDGVHVTNRGPGVDPVGRHGTVLEFDLEGTVEQLVIEPETGRVLSSVLLGDDGHRKLGTVFLARGLVTIDEVHPA